MIKEPSEKFSGNKLIAEFMGYEYLPLNTRLDKGKKYGWNRKMKWNPFVEKSGMFAGNPPEKFYLGRSHHDLQFHRNWEWLMPVFEKIIKLGYPYLISNNTCTIYKVWMQESISHSHNETTILAAWDTVVDFLKWHNQKHK